MRILIVKLSSLGDVFHVLPAVHGLNVGTGATIDWAVQDRYAELAGCFQDIRNVIAIPRHGRPRDFLSAIRRLRRERYDLVIDMQGLLKSALVAWAARGKRRIGPSFHREGSRLFYHAVAGRRDKNRHAVRENLDILTYLGLPVDDGTVFPVVFPTVNVAWPGAPRVVICPASRWKNKNWPASAFAAVARDLMAGRGAGVILLGAPGDAALCADIEAAVNGPCLNLAGKTGIVEMGGILQQADLLISNDSGPVHMAVAVGTPSLVVFGPTRPERTGPFGPRHRVIEPPARACGGTPCMRRQCRVHHPCIGDVPVECVLKAAHELLDERENTGKA